MANANEEVVRSYIASIGADDLDAIPERLADDVVFHLGGTSELSWDYRGPGRGAWDVQKDHRAARRTDAAELHDICQVTSTWWRYRGARSPGIQADAGVVYHVAHGKIAEAWVHELRQAALDAALGGASG